MDKKQTIFEIVGDFDSLDALLDESAGDITGAEEVIDQFMAELQDNLSAKVDKYAYMISDSLARADKIKDEAKRLTALAKTYENKAANLKKLLQLAFGMLGIEKINTDYHKVWVQKNGGKPSLIVSEDAVIPDKYLVEITVEQIDKELLLADLQAGIEVPGVSVKEPGSSIRIK